MKRGVVYTVAKGKSLQVGVWWSYERRYIRWWAAQEAKAKGAIGNNSQLHNIQRVEISCEWCTKSPLLAVRTVSLNGSKIITHRIKPGFDNYTAALFLLIPSIPSCYFHLFINPRSLRSYQWIEEGDGHQDSEVDQPSGEKQLKAYFCASSALAQIIAKSNPGAHERMPPKFHHRRMKKITSALDLAVPTTLILFGSL